MHCFHPVLIKGPAILHWKLWVIQVPLTFPPEIPTCVGIYSDVEGELQVLSTMERMLHSHIMVQFLSAQYRRSILNGSHFLGFSFIQEPFVSKCKQME